MVQMTVKDMAHINESWHYSWFNLIKLNFFFSLISDEELSELSQNFLLLFAILFPA